MVRRVYYKKGLSKVRQQAMEQYRATHEKLSQEHPELLSSIREKLIQAPQEVCGPDGCVAIDKRKNLQTVKRLLEITSQSAAFQAELEKMLLEI